MEITDSKEIEEILMQAQVLHLGFFDEEYPYVVPITYGYEEGRIYMHCATTGKKIDLIRRNPKVCFQAETDVAFNDAPKKTSGIALAYRSVIGFGTIRILEDNDEKREGIKVLAAHYNEKGVHVQRPDAMLRNVAILELTVDHMTGKQHD